MKSVSGHAGVSGGDKRRSHTHTHTHTSTVTSPLARRRRPPPHESLEATTHKLAVLTRRMRQDDILCCDFRLVGTAAWAPTCSPFVCVHAPNAQFSSYFWYSGEINEKCVSSTAGLFLLYTSVVLVLYCCYCNFFTPLISSTYLWVFYTN